MQPVKKIEGTVKLPGSKSLSNRILLLAALAEGTTLVKNLLVGRPRSFASCAANQPSLSPSSRSIISCTSLQRQRPYFSTRSLHKIGATPPPHPLAPSALPPGTAHPYPTARLSPASSASSHPTC